ncbi:MAG TPA: hypothetical protein VFR67_05510 [Pilimelia sp.]|nr:hypothetical protein [Pilimelia sp.]
MTRPVELGWSKAPDTPSVASPMRAVDVWRCERGVDRLALTARLRVRGDDPNLRGHFPGLPVLPGVFIIEALCQAMSLAAADQAAPPVLRDVRSVRFVSPLLDGDELTLDIAGSARGGGWRVTAEGRRGDGTLAARIRADFGTGRAAGSGATQAPALSWRTGGGREHVDVRAVLPQRHPLLLVDRVLDLDPGRRISAVKAVTATEPCFAGIRDAAEAWRYDYPSSLLIESLGQTAALLWLDGREPAPDDDGVLMFVGARNYRFDGAAHPGDTLRHEVRLESVIADTAFASGETWVGDRRIATVETLIATRRPVRRSDPVPPAVPARTAPASSPSMVPSVWEGLR